MHTCEHTHISSRAALNQTRQLFNFPKAESNLRPSPQHWHTVTVEHRHHAAKKATRTAGADTLSVYHFAIALNNGSDNSIKNNVPFKPQWCHPSFGTSETEIKPLNFLFIIIFNWGEKVIPQHQTAVICQIFHACIYNYVVMPLQEFKKKG